MSKLELTEDEQIEKALDIQLSICDDFYEMINNKYPEIDPSIMAFNMFILLGNLLHHNNGWTYKELCTSLKDAIDI
jgi:hypothetical protein